MGIEIIDEDDIVLTEKQLDIAARQALQDPITRALLNYYNMSRQDPFKNLWTTMLAQLNKISKQINNNQFRLGDPNTAGVVDFMTKLDKITVGMQSVYKVAHGGKATLKDEDKEEGPRDYLISTQEKDALPG